jgi:ketosteroid isomerase-like protein
MYESLATAMFAAVDRMDTEAFVDHLTDDVVFQFGNAPEVHGRAAVRDAVGGFFAAIAGLRHRLVDVWEGPESAVVQQWVDYTRRDGCQVTLPCVNVLRYDGDRVIDYRIYMDVSPVFAA